MKNGAKLAAVSRAPAPAAPAGAVFNTNARIPAGAIAFLPAIELAMNIARIGIYSVNPPPASVFNALANGPLGENPDAPA